MPGLFGVAAIKTRAPCNPAGFSKEALETPRSRLLIWLSIKEMAPKSRARCCLAFAPTGAALQKPIRRKAKAAWPGLRSEQTVPQPTPECRSLRLASGIAPGSAPGWLRIKHQPKKRQAGPGP